MEDMRAYTAFEDGLEDITSYCEGGYHPIRIGDVLDGRFEVVHKLGSGGFGMVWLCHDVQSNEWRAVKIMMADHSSTGQDLKVIQHLKSQATVEELLGQNIVVPLEEFWITGPNGLHHCLVMPVLGKSVQDWSTTLHWSAWESGTPQRAMCRQVAQALDNLHRYGVCHGDFRPANILMQVEGLESLSKRQVHSILGKPDLREVTKGDFPGSENWPPYCVVPLSHTPEWQNLITINKVAITDFGESFLMDDPKEDCGIPESYAAPELLFGGKPSIGSDIWALACTLYEIRSGGRKLFTNFWSETDVPATVGVLELILGPLPEPYRTVWYEKGYGGDDDGHEDKPSPRKEHEFVSWESAKKVFETREHMQSEAETQSVLQAIVAEERSIATDDPVADDEDYVYHTYRFSQQEILYLGDFLQGIIKWDPAKRKSMSSILAHPWLEIPLHPPQPLADAPVATIIGYRTIASWMTVFLATAFIAWGVAWTLCSAREC